MGVPRRGKMKASCRRLAVEDGDHADRSTRRVPCVCRCESDLSSLKVQGWSLEDQFDELKQRGVIADVVVEEKASLERIYSVFQKHRDRIAIFHFGGHADGDRLLLQSAFEPPGLCRRARHAPGTTTRTEAGLPQRLFDAPPG